MACRDEFAEQRDAEANIAKLHEVTEMLCSFCKAYEVHAFPNTQMPFKVRKWWAQHKKEDAAREARAAQARNAEKEKLMREQKRICDRLADLRKFE